jgi:hypothetical protein
LVYPTYSHIIAAQLKSNGCRTPSILKEFLIAADQPVTNKQRMGHTLRDLTPGDATMSHPEPTAHANTKAHPAGASATADSNRLAGFSALATPEQIAGVPHADRRDSESDEVIERLRAELGRRAKEVETLRDEHAEQTAAWKSKQMVSPRVQHDQGLAAARKVELEDVQLANRRLQLDLADRVGELEEHRREQMVLRHALGNLQRESERARDERGRESKADPRVAEIKSLNDERNTMREQLVQAESLRIETEQKNERTKDLLTETRRRVTALEAENTALRSAMTTNQMQTTGRECEVAELKVSLSIAGETLFGCRSELAQAKTSTADLTSLLAKEEQTALTANQELASQREQSVQQSSEIEGLQRSLSDAQNTVAGGQQALNELNERFASECTTLATTKASLEQTKLRRDELDSALQEKTAEHREQAALAFRLGEAAESLRGTLAEIGTVVSKQFESSGVSADLAATPSAPTPSKTGSKSLGRNQSISKKLSSAPDIGPPAPLEGDTSNPSPTSTRTAAFAGETSPAIEEVANQETTDGAASEFASARDADQEQVNGTRFTAASSLGLNDEPETELAAPSPAAPSETEAAEPTPTAADEAISEQPQPSASVDVEDAIEGRSSQPDWSLALVPERSGFEPAPIFATWRDNQIAKKLSTLGVAGIDDYFVGQIDEFLEARPDAMSEIASLGSNDPSFEVRIAQRLRQLGRVAFRIHFPYRDEEQREAILLEAGRLGLDQELVPFAASETGAQEPTTWHVVIGDGALGRFADPSDYVAALGAAVRHGAKTIVAERLASPHSKLALEMGDRIWQLMPERYKHNRLTDQLASRYGDVPEAETTGLEQLALFKSHFDLENFASYGHMIDRFVGPEFGANFDPEDDRDRRFVEQIASLDDAKIEASDLDPLHIITCLSQKSAL